MKRFLFSVTAATLLALPILAAGQETPVPPEAARQTPLTKSGEQDIGQQVPERPPMQTPATARRQDSRSNTVLRAQEELRKLGYDPGPIDGVLGARTREALRAYQRDSNLPATGSLNAATRKKLL
jgi:peptidoglycan hydrolase-like protein with peptidoglycan-binding domain